MKLVAEAGLTFEEVLGDVELLIDAGADLRQVCIKSSEHLPTEIGPTGLRFLLDYGAIVETENWGSAEDSDADKALIRQRCLDAALNTYLKSEHLLGGNDIDHSYNGLESPGQFLDIIRMLVTAGANVRDLDTWVFPTFAYEPPVNWSDYESELPEEALDKFFVKKLEALEFLIENGAPIESATPNSSTASPCSSGSQESEDPWETWETWKRSRPTEGLKKHLRERVVPKLIVIEWLVSTGADARQVDAETMERVLRVADAEIVSFLLRNGARVNVSMVQHANCEGIADLVRAAAAERSATGDVSNVEAVEDPDDSHDSEQSTDLDRSTDPVVSGDAGGRKDPEDSVETQISRPVGDEKNVEARENPRRSSPEGSASERQDMEDLRKLTIPHDEGATDELEEGEITGGPKKRRLTREKTPEEHVRKKARVL